MIKCVCVFNFHNYYFHEFVEDEVFFARKMIIGYQLYHLDGVSIIWISDYEYSNYFLEFSEYRNKRINDILNEE